MSFLGTITPYQLRLDFKQGDMNSNVRIHQYDKDGRTIIVTCLDNTVETLIDYLSISARVKWMKPDSEPVFNDCIVNQDGTITINITEQMSIKDGTVQAELMLLEISSGAILHTMPFKVVVVKGVFPNDTVTSSYEFDALNQALAQTDSFVAALNAHKQTPATETTMAHVKLSDSSAITTPGTFALDAVEKNASVSGTMANSISTLQSATPIIDTNGTFLNITDCIGGTSWLTDWTKNLLTAMTLANLKTLNTSGTWTDVNSTTSTYVLYSVTFTFTHNNGNILSISTTGTATSPIYFYLYGNSGVNVTIPFITVGSTYTLGGCPSGGATGTYKIFITNGSELYEDVGSGKTFTPLTNSYRIGIAVSSGVTVTNKLFLPQIESGSTKHNFVPPSGYPVYACQKNILPQSFSVLVSSNPFGTWTTVSSTVSTYLINSMTLTITHDGDKITAWSINGTSSGVSYIYYNANFALNTGTYTCSDGNTKLSMFGLKSDGTTLSLCGTAVTSASFTLSSNTVFKSWYFYIGGSVTFTNESITPQLEVGSTATIWEVYNGNTYNVTNDTVSPVPATCFSGVTNVFSGYGGNIQLLYPKTQIGKSLLDSYNSAISGTLANQLNVHKTTLSSPTVAGHSKLSNSSAITEVGSYALDATEKNASISGTLANGLSLRPLIANMFYPNNQYGGIVVTNTNTIAVSGFYTALGTATGVPNNGSSWFISHINSNVGTQSAYQRAVAYSTTLIVYERIMQSGTWGSWISISDSVKGMMSDVYSASSTYAVGDLVIYNNALYRCTTAITVAEAWNAAHWTSTTLDAEITTLSFNLAKVKPTLGTNVVDVQMSNKTVYGGSTYISSSFFIPDGYTFTATGVTAIGASGDFLSSITMQRYGNYYRATTTNSAIVDYMLQITGTISIS